MVKKNKLRDAKAGPLPMDPISPSPVADLVLCSLSMLLLSVRLAPSVEPGGNPGGHCPLFLLQRCKCLRVQG